MKPLFAMLALPLLATGFLLIPVPPSGHTIGSSVTSATLDALHQGKALRTDVLLAIGELTSKAQNDRYLGPGRTVVYGYGHLFLGAGCTAEMLPLPVAAANYLCMESWQDAMLVRRENLHGSLCENPGSAMNACQ
jgi:hypothetical protein